MSAASESKPSQDFSDIAICRGSLAAVVSGYFLTVAVVGAWPGGGGVSFDLLRGFYSLPFALNPFVLVPGICVMGVMLVIGYFVMAAYRGDHTTHMAAMIIGARTAAIGFTIFLTFAVLTSLGAILAYGVGDALVVATLIVQLVVLFALMLAVGAVTGIAARIAAGAPTVEINREAA